MHGLDFFTQNLQRLSRQDIEWVIMVKNMDAEPDEDEEAKKALSVYPQET